MWESYFLTVRKYKVILVAPYEAYRSYHKIKHKDAFKISFEQMRHTDIDTFFLMLLIDLPIACIKKHTSC